MATSPSGVIGKITISPSCPGPERLDRECVAGFAGAMVQMRNKHGDVVGQAAAASDGGFELPAAAGIYELRIEVDGLYPRCPSTQVRVSKGRFAEVTIACDSGMR